MHYTGLVEPLPAFQAVLTVFLNDDHLVPVRH